MLYFVPPLVRVIPLSWKFTTLVLTLCPNRSGSAPSDGSCEMTNFVASVGEEAAPPVGQVTASVFSIIVGEACL